MKKIGQHHYRHRGWRIVLKVVPDGLLYCLWPPEAKDRDQYVWATDTLREAREYIDEEEGYGRNTLKLFR